MDTSYDLVVIGAGPGGYVAAIRAAQYGRKVAIVENRQLGGTCLNRGCIPTKTLMHASQLLWEIKNCQSIGITVEGAGYDLQTMYARKDEVVSQLREGISRLLKANKITVFEGTGRICAPGKVKVFGEETHELQTQNILIATGSVPHKPPIEGAGLPNVFTSDQLLNLKDKQYQRLVIIGGGVIGVEFATIFNALGCQVTIIEALERVLPGMDREISQNLSMILKKRGVAIHTGAKVAKIEGSGELSCYYEEKGALQEAKADGILIATGRRPYTDDLLCEKELRLEMERGAIVVDHRFETSVPGIYAIGDVIAGSTQLAHGASAQGLAASAYICGQQEPFPDLVPACVYTDPEIACVGLSADQAKAKEIPVKTGKYLMSGNGKSLLSQQERGFIKLVVHEQTNKILGAQLMCARATDMISEIAVAIKAEMTAGQLAEVIRPHPTFSEGITEAAQEVDKKAIHSLPKR